MSKLKLIVTILALVIIISGCSPNELLNELLKHKDNIQRNPAYCNIFIGDEKDLCYAFAANIRADPELCTKIVSKDILKECFEEVAAEITDPEKCEKLRTTDEKNSCYTHVARFHKDISYCSKIVGENHYCFSAVAIATNNESLCEDADCIATIARAKNDSKLCREIPNMDLFYQPDDADKAIAECFMRYAIEKKEKEICFGFTNQEDINSCFRGVALGAEDITLCKYLKDTSDIPEVTECTIVDGEKVCEEKETFLSKTDNFKIGNCYSLIAAKDPKQCDKVAEDSMKLRNACYYHISRLNNDPAICKNIVLPGIDDVACEKYLTYHGLVAVPDLG